MSQRIDATEAGTLATLAIVGLLIGSQYIPGPDTPVINAIVEDDRSYELVWNSDNIGESRAVDMRPAYTAIWSPDMKCPLVVRYYLNSTSSWPTLDRPGRFSNWAGVTHADYTHSGYDRGHMAPNHAIAVNYGATAQGETFMMLNVVAQDPDLNQGPWRQLEHFIFNDLVPVHTNVTVFTGPIFTNEITRMESGVAIPDAFFKMVEFEFQGESVILTWIMEQDIERRADPLQYASSVDRVEHLTRFDFFSGITNEAVIESRVLNLTEIE